MPGQREKISFYFNILRSSSGVNRCDMENDRSAALQSAKSSGQCGDAFGEKREETVGVDIAKDECVGGKAGDPPPIDHRHAQGEIRLAFDGDIDFAPAEKFRFQ